MATFNGQNHKFETDEQLGAFGGYIRRPTPSSAGMMAQIFGEDGYDADTILALSLTKYKDLKVFVNMYLVKDSVGQPMKKDGKYPLIASFMGYVRRSTPKQDGMIANLFASNGTDSDAVSELTKSEYQGCLVYVDIRGVKAEGNMAIIEAEAIEAIKKSYGHRLTKAERDEIESLDRKYSKKNEMLAADFLSRIEVLSALGTGEEFKEWLRKSPCSYRQEDMCLNAVVVAKVEGLLEPYNYLPSCADHIHEMEDYNHFNDDSNRMFYEMRHRYLLKQWAQHKLNQRFCDDGHKEPNPARVLEWAAVKGIGKYLPPKYTVVV